MLKINKITRYGVSILAVLAENTEENPSSLTTDKKINKEETKNTPVLSVPDIALKTFIPIPTVAKIMKLLVKAKLAKSLRGSVGGYALARHSAEINIAEIVEALEGKITITDCLESSTNCQMSKGCTARLNWIKVNEALKNSLTMISLEDMNSSSGCK